MAKPMAEPLLQINNLTLANGTLPLIHGINLRCGAGETLGLVGESGSGKSLTCMAIAGILPYFQPWNIGGTMQFMGHAYSLADMNNRRHHLGVDIGYIFQDSLTSLNPLHTIKKQLAEAILTPLSANDKNEYARQLCSEMQLPNNNEFMGRYPHQLSGGQRQRVMIAMAIANKPQLIIADEPITALDAHLKGAILQLLQQYQQKNGCSLIYISHELASVKKLCHQVMVLQGGHCVEQGPTAQIWQNPTNDYTKLLLAKPTMEFRNLPPCLQPKGEPILSLQQCDIYVKNTINLWKSTQKTLIHIDDLHIYNGQSLGVMGESGSGKSSLALGLLQLLPSHGKMVFLGHHINQYNTKKLLPLRKKMQMVFQDPYSSLSPKRNIEQIIGEGLDTHEKDLTPAQKLQKISEMLVKVGMNDGDMHKYPHEFSGGQRQRIALARALILQPQLIIMDEPTSALDQLTTIKIIALIRHIQQTTPVTCLFISHDLAVISQLCDRICVLHNGKIIEQGPTHDIINNPQNQYTKLLVHEFLENQ